MDEQQLINAIMAIKRVDSRDYKGRFEEFHPERERIEKARLKLVKQLTGLTKAQLRTASTILSYSRFDQEKGVICYNRKGRDTWDMMRPTEGKFERLAAKGLLRRGERRYSLADLMFKMPTVFYWHLDARLVKWRDAIGHWGWY